MATSQEHYDQHLGPVYTWMLGDFNAACLAAQEELKTAEATPKNRELVVDLGCGSGQYAIALAKLGASVLALDSCEMLVEEVKTRAVDLDIRAIRSDILSFRKQVHRPVSGVFCMGDTLTHLPRVEDVEHLLREVAAVLKEEGVFVATFRDYTGVGPVGDARFVPVRSDSNRILTCFIEYGQNSVDVMDLIHDRHGDTWQLRISSYKKLKLEPRTVAAILEECGCSVRIEDGPRGMVRIVAVR